MSENIFDQYPINILTSLLGKTEEEVKNMNLEELVKELIEKVEELSMTKQDLLINQLNIKSINGECILGEGDLVIEETGSGISDAPSDGKKYVRSNASWVEETTIDTSNFATKDELSGKQDKGDYALKSEVPEDYVLPIASESTLGGIKSGKGIAIDSESGIATVSIAWDDITTKPETFKPETHQHVSVDITDLQDKLDQKANTSDLSNFITNSVDNLVNYYNKSEVNGLIGALKSISLKPVDSLPDTGEENIIYLVKKVVKSRAASTGDVYDEFIWVASENSYEIIGNTKIDLSNYYNKTESDDKFATKTELSEKQDKGDYALKSDLTTKLDTSTYESEKVNFATKTELSEGYQPKGDYLTEHQDISGKLDVETYNSEKVNFATKDELSGKQDKGDYALKSELEPLAVKSEVTESLGNKQDTLVSGTTIKTVNGESLLGSGNVEINVISDAPSDSKKYVRSNASWVEETTIDTSNFATKDELAGKQDKGNYATQEWVGEQNYLTEHQDISGKLDTATYESEKSNFATKTELAEKQNKGDYALKSDLTTKLDTSTYNSEKSNFATKEELANATPTIGENGNWTIGGEDSGKSSKGADGLSIKSIKLIKSADGTITSGEATMSDNSTTVPITIEISEE